AVDTYLRTVTELPPEPRAMAVAELREAVGDGAGLLRPLSAVLGPLIDAPELAADERHDQFAAAVAGFLSGLARLYGGLLLVLEDVQWLDSASRAVLRQTVTELASAPALVLATGRDDEQDVLKSCADWAGARLDLQLALGPLDDASIARLVSADLAGAVVSPAVVADLVARAHGNPLLVQEYLLALIEAGALRPCWGTWQLDADRLQAIELPGTVFELVLARVAGLGEEARELLTVAAALGDVDVDVLAEVAGKDPATALAEAVHRGVLHESADGYTFVHDRAREALLSVLEPVERRRLHQRIAEVLDARGGDQPAQVYALARHYAAGEVDRTPDRVLGTGWAAGQLALQENAPTAAVTLLQPAVTAAVAAGLAVDSRVRETLAKALLATGHADSARDQLEPALAAETDPVRRAALHLQLATVRRMRWELTASLRHVRAGLAELGRPVPRHPLALAAVAVWLLIRWLIGGSRHPTSRPVTGEGAERLRLELHLRRAGATASAMGLQSALMPIFTLGGVNRMHRLGIAAEYALSECATGVLSSLLRLRRRRDRIFARSRAVAAELRDPQLAAEVTWIEGFAKVMAGDITGAEFARIADAQSRWLEADFISNIALMRARELLAQGHVREALDWHDRGRARLSEATVVTFTAYALVEAAGQSLLGQAGEVPSARTDVARRGADVGYWMQYLPVALQIAVEQDELGDLFTDAVAALHRVEVPVRTLLPEHRMAFVYESLGWLAKAQRAKEGKAELIDRAADAVRRLGKAADQPLLRVYHRICEASLEQLRGRAGEALTRLAQFDDQAARADAPLARYEACRVRARALLSVGATESATEQAEFALMLAHKHGWARRAGWIRAEFGTTPRASGTFGRSASQHSRRTYSAAPDRYRRRLEALQQVNAAAATVLDPRQLAVIALDEILRILGAERAVLFLSEAGQPVRFALGRTRTGELTELTGYSASLVERVADERQPLVVTGGEQGAALGSQSAVVHGLRSIMIAPLELDGRLLGVLYLDSRVAKGIFTDDDVDILAAVCAQVAVSLETARAAQLEVAVSVARQQRDTAETLRDAVNRLTSTLDPEEVLQGLCAVVGGAVPADRVCLVRRDGAAVAVTRAASATGPEATDLSAGSGRSTRAGAAGGLPPGTEAELF
ncbi:MAG TPA: GAF domain-containing protein, partial [Actinoplanes sp.]|nr:GAF domain-containing protein [Actinoplanes sp.]